MKKDLNRKKSDERLFLQRSSASMLLLFIFKMKNQLYYSHITSLKEAKPSLNFITTAAVTIATWD